MAHSEARGTATQTSNVAGLDVSEAQLTPAEYLELMNGPALADVPHVRGEKVVQQRGAVPTDWSLS